MINGVPPWLRWLAGNLQILVEWLEWRQTIRSTWQFFESELQCPNICQACSNMLRSVLAVFVSIPAKQTQPISTLRCFIWFVWIKGTPISSGLSSSSPLELPWLWDPIFRQSQRTKWMLRSKHKWPVLSFSILLVLSREWGEWDDYQ